VEKCLFYDEALQKLEQPEWLYVDLSIHEAKVAKLRIKNKNLLKLKQMWEICSHIYYCSLFHKDLNFD
jgi:hypothetical protein